jgi:hypothetical protein
MGTGSIDPLRRAAGQVADCLAGSGYAFIEDDKLEALAATLRSFLLRAGIAVEQGQAGREIGAQRHED